ncbi:60S ribosomal protein L31 [Lemmus lemmus]
MHKFSMKELGFPDVCTDTRFNKAVLANEIRNDVMKLRSHQTRCVLVAQESPNKTYVLVTCVPASTFRSYSQYEEKYNS